ncbi:MAG: winged helix-turn-helix transcriptional regulator [Actinobacteria bacterium]|nr:winged helix-turn-helix transcriptional regulator [Actinomycetota bacterium]
MQIYLEWVDAWQLYLLARVFRQIALRATADPGQPPASLSVLAIVEDVARHQGTSISDVTQRTHLAQSLVSKTVTELSDAGVLTCQRDPSDGRRTLVSVDPTAHAREFVPRGARPIDQAIRQTLPDITVEQLNRVLNALDTLADLLLDNPASQHSASFVPEVGS